VVPQKQRSSPPQRFGDGRLGRWNHYLLDNSMS
jgi:hypothetical protein